MRWTQYLNPAAIWANIKQKKQTIFWKAQNLKIGLHSSIHSSQIGMNCIIGNHSATNNSILGDSVCLMSDILVSKSSIGSFSYIGNKSRINNTVIGKFSSLSANLVIGFGEHPVNFVSTHPAFYSNDKCFECFADGMYFDETGEPITIGNDVWIGYSVIVMTNLSKLSNRL